MIADMTYYGLCPVRDEFYLVTCNYCRRVCTPQGLKSHIGKAKLTAKKNHSIHCHGVLVLAELKHTQEWNSCNQTTDVADSCAPPASSTSASASTAKPKAAKKAQAAGQGAAAVPTSLAYLLATPAAPANNRPRGASNKRAAGKPAVALPTPLSSALTGTSFDKIPSPQQPPPAALPIQFSPLQPTLTAPSPVSPLTSATSGLTSSPAITMTLALDSSGNQTVQIHLPELGNGVMLADSPVDVPASSASGSCSVSLQGSRSNGPLNSSGAGIPKKRKNSKGDGSGRRLLPLKERELDLEKHCGVWIGDINRACTRSLTCKAHSLTLRRNVQGRSRSFDDLLAEHRAAKELLMKQLKDATNTTPAGVPLVGAVQLPSATKPLMNMSGTAVQQTAPKLGRPPLARPPPAKKLLTQLQQPAELSLSLELPPAETTGVQQMPSTGLLQRINPTSAALPLQSASTSLTFTPHHPKPLAVCSFGLRRRQVLGVVTSDRKWDFLRSTIRSSFLRSGAAVTSAAAAAAAAAAKPAAVSRSTVSAGFQSLLRPTLNAVQQQHHPLQPRETNSIELPNGLQLSIGVQPDGNKYERL